MNKSAILIIITLAVVIGLGTFYFDSSLADKPSGQKSFESMDQVGQEQMLEMLEQGETVLIDIRTEQEFESGAIPNAHHMPIANIMENPDMLERFNGKKLVFYCHSGGRVKRLAQHLIDVEHPAAKRFIHLSGDYSGWRDAGRNISR